MGHLRRVATGHKGDARTGVTARAAEIDVRKQFAFECRGLMTACTNRTKTVSAKTPKPTRETRALPNQSAFAEIAEVAAGRALHHVDGELEQANFPGVVHPLNHSAERFVRSLHAAFCAIDHCVD